MGQGHGLSTVKNQDLAVTVAQESASPTAGKTKYRYARFLLPCIAPVRDMLFTSPQTLLSNALVSWAVWGSCALGQRPRRAGSAIRALDQSDIRRPGGHCHADTPNF